MRQTRLQNPDSIILEMRNCLEEKFQVFDSKLVKLRHGIEARSQRLTQEIEHRLDLDSQCHKLNSKRNELLTQLFNTESANVTATNTTISSRLYHKYDESRSELELVRYLVFKHTQLVYHNDFELFAKFGYYHLFNNLRTAYPPSHSTNHKKQSFFLLNANTQLVHSKEENQLCLINRRFETIKRVNIKVGYSCYQIFKLLEYVILNFTSQQLKKSQLYVCDFELRPVKKRVFDDILFVRCSQDKILYSKGDILLIYNLNLDLVESLFIEKRQPFDYIIHNCERFVSRCLDTSLIRVFSEKGSSLITEIPSGPMVKLFVDMNSNIYVISKGKMQECFQLACFDYNGKLVFEQLFIFQNFDFFVKNGEQFYLFDGNLTVKCIF